MRVSRLGPLSSILYPISMCLCVPSVCLTSSSGPTSREVPVSTMAVLALDTTDPFTYHTTTQHTLSAFCPPVPV